MFKLFLLVYLISIALELLLALANGNSMLDADYKFFLKPVPLASIMAVIFHYGKLGNWHKKNV